LVIISAHHEQDIRRVFQGTAEDDDTFRREPIHEIGMLSPLRREISVMLHEICLA
jgi:hypothetical protein